MQFNVSEKENTANKSEDSAKLDTTVNQEIASQLEKLSQRILSLETSANNATQHELNDSEGENVQESIRKVELSFDEKLKQMSVSFQKKLDESNSNHTQMLKNSEDRLLKRIGELCL